MGMRTRKGAMVAAPVSAVSEGWEMQSEARGSGCYSE